MTSPEVEQTPPPPGSHPNCCRDSGAYPAGSGSWEAAGSGRRPGGRGEEGAAGSAGGMRREGAGGTRGAAGSPRALCVPLRLPLLPLRSARSPQAPSGRCTLGWERGTDCGFTPQGGPLAQLPACRTGRGRHAIRISFFWRRKGVGQPRGRGLGLKPRSELWVDPWTECVFRWAGCRGWEGGFGGRLMEIVGGNPHPRRRLSVQLFPSSGLQAQL